MFCNVIETLYVSHADFKRFVMFCKRLSCDSVGLIYKNVVTSISPSHVITGMRFMYLTYF